MKNYLLALSVAVLTVSGCIFGGKKGDLVIPVESIETAGPAFNRIVIAGPASVFSSESPLDPKQLYIRASIPCVKAIGVRLAGLSMSVDLLDANGSIVLSGLYAEGLADIIPVLEAGEGVSRTIIFVSEMVLDKSSVKRALEKTSRLRVNVFGLPGADLSADQDKPAPSGPPTLNTLIRKYNKARNVGFDWQKKEDVWDKVREELGELEAELRKDPSDAKNRADKEFDDDLADQFDDWIDDRMDKIDDKY